MRYLYAALITLALAAGWGYAARDILRARRDARARAAVRNRLTDLPAGMPDRRAHPEPLGDHLLLYRADPEGLAALRQLRDEQRAAAEPDLVRPYVADLPADVADERPAPGWLTVREAATIGRHPFRPGVDPDRCAHPFPGPTPTACYAVRADPVHFVPTGILQQPTDPQTDSDG